MSASPAGGAQAQPPSPPARIPELTALVAIAISSAAIGLAFSLIAYSLTVDWASPAEIQTGEGLYGFAGYLFIVAAVAAIAAIALSGVRRVVRSRG